MADSSTATADPTTASTTSTDTSGTDQLANIQAAQLAAQVANWAAQLEFAKQRFQLMELPQAQAQSQLAIDQLAFQKATEAWQQAFQEASLTGTYQGQTTTAWLTQQAQLTGVLNGTQTVQGKLTDAQVAQMNSAMQIAQQNQLLDVQKFGFQQTQWNAEFALSKAGQQLQYMGVDENGNPTLAKTAQDATITGYDAQGNPTLARQTQEASEAQQYLSLLSSLQGPQNAFVQARVLGNTPNSIRDIANAWAGKYQIGGTTGSGQNPTPASVGGLMGSTGLPGTLPGGSLAGTTTDGGYTFATPNAISSPGLKIPTSTTPTVGPGIPAVPTYAAPVSQYPVGGQPVPAPTPAAGPTAFNAIPSNDGPVPGRGLDPSQWNAATQAAVSAWNAAHPGFQANGTQLGYGYVGPVQATGTLDFNSIPGRGMDPTQWNPATQQAVAAWNASHPGYVANGSQIGYSMTGPGTPGPAAKIDPTPPGPLAPVPYVPPASQTPAPAYTTDPAQAPAPAPTAAMSAPATQAAVAASTTPAAAAATPAVANYTAPAASAYSTSTSAAPAGEAASATYSPPGVQAPVGDYNYTPTASGAVTMSPPGVAADPSDHQVSSSTPASADDLSKWFTNLQPNQINAENYGNMNEYAQKLGWAAFQDQGWDVGAAQDAFQKSLPRYGGPAAGSFAALG